MHAELPFSKLIMLLIFFLPGIFLFADYIVKKNTDDKEFRTVISPGLFICIWLLCVHVTALFSKNFLLGLVLGTILPSIPGYILNIKQKDFFIDRKIFYTALICTIFIVPATFLWDFHDKIGGYSSHFSVVSQILNNVYPPRDIYFPLYNLGYHYGIDTLFAMVSAITRLPVDFSIDIVTLSLFFYSMLLFGYLGKKLYGNGVFSVILGAFGSGLPFLAAKGQYLTTYFLGAIQVNSNYLNPPVISYFFQPPWTIGFPLLLMVFICLFCLNSGELRNKPGNLILLLLPLLVLGFSNTTAFLCIIPSIVFYNAISRGKFSISAVALASIPIVFFISGFKNVFLHQYPFTDAKVIFAANGVTGGAFIDNLKWNIGTLGMLLSLGIAGFFFTPGLKALFFPLLAGSLLVVNLFVYNTSWDIVKFAVIAQLVLIICSAGFLNWLWFTKKFKISALISLLTLISFGMLYTIPFLFDLSPNPFPRAICACEIKPDDYNVISYLRKQINPGEMVLSSREKSYIYAYWGGFPEFWTDHITRPLGFSGDLINHREDMNKNLPPDIDLYRKEGVKWIVIDADEDNDSGLMKIAQNWEKQNLITIKATYGKIKIYKIKEIQHESN